MKSKIMERNKHDLDNCPAQDTADLCATQNSPLDLGKSESHRKAYTEILQCLTEVS